MLKRLSLSVKLTLVILSVTFFSLVFFLTLVTLNDSRQDRLNQIGKIEMLAGLAAEYSVSDLAFRYQQVAEANLGKLFQLPEIEEIQIYDEMGILFAAQTRPGLPLASPPGTLPVEKGESVCFADGRVEVHKPMTYLGKRHGTLRLVAVTQAFQDIFVSRLKILGTFFLGVFTFALLLTLVFQAWITRPLLLLITQVREIAEGNLKVRIGELPGWGEIRELSRCVNQMADALAHRMREIEEGKEFLELVTENIPVGVFWKNRDHSYVWANRFFQETAGVTQLAEIIGKTDQALPWRKEESDFFMKTDRLVLEGDAPQENIIASFQRADGMKIWLDTSKLPMHDKEGKVIGVLGSFIDITRRKMAEEAMAKLTREQQEAIARYETFIGASNTGAWEFHTDTGFLWCSPEYFTLLGRDKRDYDLSGSANFENVWAQLIHPEDREKARQHFISYLKNPVGMYQQHFRMQHKDGRWIWIWSRGKTLRNDSGQLSTTTVGTNIDVTDRYHLETRLRQSEKMEAIGQLAGGVAHDFNNQLAGIIGTLDLVLMKLTDPELRRLAENAKKSALRSAELTKQLLAFGRKGKFVIGPVNIHTLIDELVVLLAHSLDRRIVVNKHFGAISPVTLGDTTQLQNALLNLAINARDAMPQGGELTFSTTIVDLEEKAPDLELTPGSYLKIGVTDTGVGIPKEILEHLFEPFFTTKEIGKGTGLGLAAVFGAVKNHGGAITVYSEIGKGTAFHIYLPLAEDTGLAIPAPASLPEIESGHGHILVAEDEEVICQTFQTLLPALGYKVTICKNGKEAVDYYQTGWKETDLVILDMIMPLMNGQEAFLAMRKINPDIKALVTSGFGVNGMASKILEAGALGFLQKPFQIGELSRKLREILQPGSGPVPGKKGKT